MLMMAAAKMTRPPVAVPLPTQERVSLLEENVKKLNQATSRKARQGRGHRRCSRAATVLTEVDRRDRAAIGDETFLMELLILNQRRMPRPSRHNPALMWQRPRWTLAKLDSK